MIRISKRGGNLHRGAALAGLVLFAQVAARAEGVEDLAGGFKQPPDSAKPGVYWYFMDGNISTTGMTRDLEAMKAAGLGRALFLEVNVGVPRGPVPFLGEEWKRAFVHAVRESERLGIEIVMGIGPGWTGSGGPWVEPAGSMQHLVGARLLVKGPGPMKEKLPVAPPVKPYFGMPDQLAGKWQSYFRDVAVLAFPTPAQPLKPPADLAEKALYVRDPISSAPGVKPHLTEPPDETSQEPRGVDPRSILDLTNKLRPDGSLDWQVPAGEWTVVRLVARNNGMSTRPSPEPGIGFECDKFDPKALDDHLKNFVMELRKQAGKSPSDRGWTTLHMDSWEMGAQNWSPVLRDEFKRRRGYDPVKWYPALLGDVIGNLPETERFLWDLRRTGAELIVDNHAFHLKQRGAEMGMRLSIEPYDMHPGVDFDLAAVADVPMAEFWSAGHGFNTAFSCLQSVSVGAVMGRPVVAAESFTAEGSEAWKLYPGALKNQGDWALAAGINRFFFHTFAHKPDETKPGMVMGPYGVHWDRGQTWWPMAGAFHEYLSRCQYLLSQGTRVADILYLLPEGAPTVFQPPVSAYDGTTLMPDARGHAVDGCSARALIGLAKAADGCVVFPGGARYRMLVLPDRETMTPELLGKVVSLVKAGVTVVGRPPGRSPGLTDYPRCDKTVADMAREAWGTLEVPAQTRSKDLGKGRLVWGGDFSRVSAQSLLAKANWIWHPTGQPAVSYPIGGVYFKRTLDSPTKGNPVSARIAITADNTYEVRLNGKSVGKGDDFRVWREYGLTELLNADATNELLIRADNVEAPGPAGLLAAVELTYSDGSREVIASGPDWLVRQAVNETAWPDGNAAGWQAALACGPAGMAPWNLALRDEKNLYPLYQDTATLLEKSDLPPDFLCDGPVRFCHRRSAGVEIYFLSNRSDEKIRTKASFRVAGRAPELWDPMDSTRRALVHYETHDKLTTIPLEFEPHGSCFVMFPETPSRDLPRAAADFPVLTDAATLGGSWMVSFDPKWGGPGTVEFKELADWSRSSDPGIRHYSGIATYTTRFDLPADAPKDRDWFVDLGQVNVIARVRLNGAEIGTAWTRPYRLPLGRKLKPAGNLLEIEVANLWPNRMIGDAAGNGPRYSQATYQPYKAGDPLLPSGLIGPVRLLSSGR